jgi:hypothetical protein
MLMFRQRGSRQRRGCRAGRRPWPALQPFLLVGLLGVALATYTYLPMGGAVPAGSADPPAAPAAVQTPAVPTAAQGTPGAAPAANPMDQPLRLIYEAYQAYQGVKDYTCVLIKQERVKGQLQPENVIQMKFRNQPFSVYMRWVAPKNSAGQEVCFVKGRNNDMMRVHSTGLIAGAIGWINIAVNDPRTLEHSRHTILEAGIGNMINQIYQDWYRARQENKTQVRIAEYQYDRRPCTRVESFRTERDARSYCYRAVIYFDKQTHLPVRMECYDWPRPGGPPEGELLESFSYVNMQLNPGLPDAAFNY